MNRDKAPPHGDGKECCLEIPAIDADCAAGFYNAVSGWQVRRRSDRLLAFDDAVNEVSDTWVPGRKAAMEPGLLIYIMVESVAAPLDAMVVNGGGIVQSLGMDAPEITARFSDPDGNVSSCQGDES